LPQGFDAAPPRPAPLDEKLLDGVCRPELKRLILRCLDPDPLKRYPDARAVQEAMHSLLK
jgi:hypothetical protein